MERLLQFASALGGTVRVLIDSHDVLIDSQDAAPDEEAKTLALTA